MPSHYMMLEYIRLKRMNELDRKLKNPNQNFDNPISNAIDGFKKMIARIKNNNGSEEQSQKS